MFDNVGLKFLSMVLAVTVFLLVNTDKDREITARVGVSYTMPEDKVLISDRVEEVAPRALERDAGSASSTSARSSASTSICGTRRAASSRSRTT